MSLEEYKEDPIVRMDVNLLRRKQLHLLHQYGISGATSIDSLSLWGYNSMEHLVPILVQDENSISRNQRLLTLMCISGYMTTIGGYFSSGKFFEERNAWDFINRYKMSLYESSLLVRGWILLHLMEIKEELPDLNDVPRSIMDFSRYIIPELEEVPRVTSDPYIKELLWKKSKSKEIPPPMPIVSEVAQEGISFLERCYSEGPRLLQQGNIPGLRSYYYAYTGALNNFMLVDAMKRMN